MLNLFVERGRVQLIIKPFSFNPFVKRPVVVPGSFFSNLMLNCWVDSPILVGLILELWCVMVLILGEKKAMRQQVSEERSNFRTQSVRGSALESAPVGCFRSPYQGEIICCFKAKSPERGPEQIKLKHLVHEEVSRQAV